MSVQPDKTVRTARLELRLSVQERERIEVKAKVLGMSLSDYIRLRCLGGDKDGPRLTKTASTGHHHDPSYVLPKPQDTPKPYGCPDSRCDLRFGSPAATCPHHGRKAVPVA